jgi:hypothetical protein
MMVIFLRLADFSAAYDGHGEAKNQRRNTTNKVSAIEKILGWSLSGQFMEGAVNSNKIGLTRAKSASDTIYFTI